MGRRGEADGAAEGPGDEGFVIFGCGGRRRLWWWLGSRFAEGSGGGEFAGWVEEGEGFVAEAWRGGIEDGARDLARYSWLEHCGGGLEVGMGAGVEDVMELRC